MSNLIFISLQAAGNSMMSLLMMLSIFVVFFFFFIRPQMNKQKEQTSYQNNLKKGDEVVTASGMIGRINKIDEKEVLLELGEKTFVRFTKGAISKEMTEGFFGKKEEA